MDKSTEKRYLCPKCGQSFTDKKSLTAHTETCNLTLLKQIEEVNQKINLLLLSHVDVSKHVSVCESCIDQLAKSQKIELDKTIDKIIPKDCDCSLSLKAKGLDLYKVNDKGELVKLVPADLIEKIVKKDFKSI